MSGRHEIDKTKPRAKDKDVRAKVAERVNITAREQGLCRIEGFKMALRMLPPGKYVDAMTRHGEKRWGEDWSNVPD